VSLTDRAGWAVCAGDDSADIGCDLVLVEPRSDRFVEDYFVPSEQDLVHDPPFDASPDLMANLIWSAKESGLRLLRTGLRRDTRSVQVTFFPGRSGGWLARARRSTCRGAVVRRLVAAVRHIPAHHGGVQAAAAAAPCSRPSAVGGSGAVPFLDGEPGH
jgi:hypothetical protein